MSVADEKRLRKSIQARAFERVYYLHGDEDLLKEQAVRDLLDAAIDPATRDFNLDVRGAASLDGESLASLLGTPPMMADRRAVVVRDVSALKKDARAALDAYLREPSPDVLLVLVEPGGDRGKPDKELASLDGAVKIDPLKEDRLPRWVAHHVSSVLGTTIQEGAVELLTSVVGNDLAALAAELDKAASYTGGAEIDEEAISAVVGVRRGETVADFIARVMRRDANGALDILGHVLEQPKAGGVPIVMALGAQVLAASYAQAALAKGLPRAKLYPEMFNLLKATGGPFVGMTWGEAVKLWSAVASSWPPHLVDRALDALLTADMMLKESSISNERQVLATLVFEICAPEEAVVG